MLAEKPWRLEAVGRLFLGVITTFCLGAIAAGLLAHFTKTLPTAQADFWQIVVSAIFLEIPAVVWIALFLRYHDIGWNEAFGFQITKPVKAIACGLLVGALAVPSAWALQLLSTEAMKLLHLTAEDQPMVQELENMGLNVPEKFVLGLIAIVIAPVVEEMLFRGILYPAIKKTGWPRLALWGSSALFALVHFNVATFVPLMIFAAALVYLYEFVESLLAPIAAHALFNAANFLVLIFQTQIDRALHPK